MVLLLALGGVAVLGPACGSDGDAEGKDAASGGGSPGQMTGGTGGGTSPALDARPTDGTGTAPDSGPGGPSGMQPLGSVCANTGNCSQATGAAVCCVNTCKLVADCPQPPGYIPCMRGSDCAQYGGSWVCCEAGGMRFCTKQSACGGQIIP
jgi:hypothetical protein